MIVLRERRARLVVRARGERERLAALLSRAEAAFRWIEVGRRVLEGARRQPLIVVAGAALLFALRPRRAVKLLASGWSLWQLYRRARRWWLRIASLPEGAGQRAP